MSFTDDYNALKKKRKKQEKEKVAASSGTKFEKQYYTAAVDREPVEDIAPVRTTTTTFEAPTKGTVEILLNKSEKNSSTDYFGNETKKAQEKRTVFKSGEGNVAQKILGTIGDAAVGLAKGFVGSFEGLTDLATYGAAGVVDLLGNDELADDMKNAARESQTDKLLGGLEAKADKYSVLGDKADTFTNVLGQVASLFVGGGVGKAAGFGAKGVSAITTGMTAASSMGSGIGEAYEGGATDGEAVAFGAMSGLIDAGTELLAGGLGKSLGALGISRGIGGLDDMFAKKLASKVTGKIGNEFWKTTISNVTEFGVKSAAEGAEEVLAGYGSALAKKMTYMSDEELGQLVKDENILEQFVMGTLAGGVVSTPGLVSSTKGGTDYVTGYTQSEQKVIEAEVEKRITEAENNGEKPNKSKIYDEVVRDMEKGYIDTDTIESVLGGETYKSYRDTVEGEDALQSEFDALNKMKQGEMTGEQIDRRAELKEKLAEIKQNSQRDTLKAQLGEEVFGLAQGSRLSESYAERARRGQVFEADLSKYDDKQKAVIQKAIDSGILNNTNRTHEFVDMVAKISADKGVLFDFTNNEKLKGSSFAVDGAAVNGFITKDGITVNIDSRKAVNSVVGHEITHVLEGTELYTELQTALFEYAKGKGDYQGRYDTLAKLYEGVEGADVDAELAADLVGDYLFTDSDFINSLSTKHRNVFQKVYDEIKYLCKIATAGSREARELERVKRAFDKAYRESGKVSSDTKYSLSDNEGKQLTKEQSEYFKDSKMRDDNGNLKVMYHGSQDAGFHVFDPSMSDDDISLFFVDRNDVAASYSGTTETYEAQTIRTAEDMNNFIESIGVEGYEVVEKDGEFTLLYEGERVAASDSAQGIYKEFCWYEGVGEGDANYKVYLNLKNPLVVDAEGNNWNNVSREYSQEIADRYNSLTAEEKDALRGLAEWGEISIFRDELREAALNAERGGGGMFDEAYTRNLANAYRKLGGASANLYDAFSIAEDNFSEDALRRFAVKQMNTRDYAQRAKAEGYDGVIIKNVHDNGGYSNGDEGASTVAIAFSSEQVKSVANRQPTGDPDIRYSLSEDSEGNKINPAVAKRFGNSKAVDENGSLKVLYHGTAAGEFSIFDKSKGSVEGDFGSGFYFTDNEYDVTNNYEGGGPDFDNKVSRRAEEIYNEALDEDNEITYDEAEKQARAELYKGGHKFGVYLNIENPAIVGETILFDPDSYYSEYNREDYDNEDDYYGDVEQLIVDDIDGIIWDIEKNVDIYSTDGISDVLWEAFNEGGVDLEKLKKQLGKLFLEDSNGHPVENEVARQIVESLGYDGIIDPAVSTKWNMDMEPGTTHYIVFKPNQIKAVTNENPTDNPDIHRSLSAEGETPKRYGKWNVYGKDIRYTPTELAPVQDSVQDVQDSVQDAPVAETTTKETPSEALYNKRDGANGWGEVYGTAHEAINDAVKHINPELWEAIDEEIENSLWERISSTPMTDALIAVQEDVRQDTITPMQGAQLLAEAYKHGGEDGLKRLYNPATGNLYDQYLERAKRYGAVAPVADDVSDIVDDVPDVEPREPSLQEMRERQDALYEELEAAIAREDAEAFSRIGEEYNRVAFAVQQMEADEAARLSSLDDADAPPEVDAPYYEEDAAEVADPFDDRDIKAVGDRKVKAYMYENPEVKPFFQEEANILLGELREGTKGERIYTPTPDGQPGVYGSDSYGIWHGVKRHVSPDIEYLLDTVKMSYADIEKGLRAIIEDHGAENIAAAKKIEFVLNDRLLKGYQEQTLGAEIPPNQDYVNLINEKQITAYTDEARQSFFESVGATEIKPEVEDIAPVAEKYEAIRPPKQTAEPRMKRAEPKMKRVKEVEDDGKVAEVLTDEPKVNKSRTSAWAMFKNNVLDKGMVFEDLALETGNRELQARWNSIRYAEGKAQRLMENGKANISSLKSIRETVEKSGKTQQFYEYLYHLHNVDRMSLEGRGAESIAKWRDYFKGLTEKQIQAIAAKEITDSTTEKTADGIRGAREYLNALDTKNKPVFGDSVTAEVSKETAAELESANPEFVEWSSEVYSYMNYLREELVANGVISRDTAKLWAEIYPHYVPIRRAGKDGAAINVPLDTGRTGINAPIKRATGGNSDILPLFDTMGQRTIQTYRAIAKNRFGVELKNTLGTTIGNEAAGVDDTIDSIDADEGLLQEGKDGNAPTFTVFENGERVTFEITEEMYDAMKPTSKGLSYTNKVANTVGSVFRGLLTEYNPVFMTTNAVKDVQDILINSQHAARTYVNIPNAIAQMASGGRWYREYLDNGGERNTYFDNHSNTFKAEDNAVKKIVGMPLRIISGANNFIERVPRLAEYIASRKAGRSIDVSMLDAARVTTNFAAGGDLTKMLNRNGFNFLNASTQGAIQQVRNVREAKANGLRGWVQLAAKVTLAGLPALLLNDLLWDDDEEYEELADYVKDNYYIVAKYGDGQFVRIPKGRTLAVIQDAFEQMRNKITGDDEVDLKSFLDLAITNLAPNNPLDNNIIAPISQALSNRTWYGEDLVPTRLQDLPAAEQYDESTDSISKWLGERLDVSPYKLNYLLNQYSGGIGDVVLPMLTPETDGGGILAPFTDKFTADSVLNNQNVSDFYDTMDELTRNAKSSKATDEDILSYKYMNSVNAELGELYAEKREIQNSDLSDRAKLDAVRSIQEKIDSITRESLDAYGKVNIQGKYATVGDLHYKWYEPGEDSDTEPGWQKISDKQLQKQNEVTRGLGISASEYWSNKEEYDYAYDNPEKYAVAKSVGGYSAYKSYQSELYDIKADKDESGKSISGSRKEKVIDYVNGLDIDYGARLVLFKSEYNADDTYNYEIIDYLNSREDISYEDTVTILKELGFTVDSEGNIYW